MVPYFGKTHKNVKSRFTEVLLKLRWTEITVGLQLLLQCRLQYKNFSGRKRVIKLPAVVFGLEISIRKLRRNASLQLEI